MKFALIAGLFFLVTSASAQQPVSLLLHTEAAGRRAAWPLDIEWLRKMLQQNPLLQGLELSQAQIFPPPDFTTGIQDPEMEVRRIQENLTGNRLFIALRCHKRNHCSSFLVEVALPKPKTRDANITHYSLLSAPFSAGAFHKKPNPEAPGPVLVQPHTPAMLVIEEDGLRITEPVLPQKRARLGELVRVNDPSAHRSMMAEVIGRGLLAPSGETNEQRLGRMQ